MALSKKFLILIKVALLKGTQSPNALAHLISFMSWRIWISQDTLVNQKIDKRIPTGSPSSKYEHRRASALLRNIQNIRICMGKKSIVSVTYGNERISMKNSLPYFKCVLHLSCVVHGPIYGRFMGFYVNGFLYRERIQILIFRMLRTQQCRCSPMLIFRAWATCACIEVVFRRFRSILPVYFLKKS